MLRIRSRLTVLIFSLLGIFLLAGCGEEAGRGEIHEVSLRISPSYGAFDEMADTVATVSGDGGVILEVTLQMNGSLVSRGEAFVDSGRVQKLWDTVEKSGFYDLPETIDDEDVCDGAYKYITVETAEGIYTAGGLEADSQAKAFGAVYSELIELMTEAGLW